MPIPTIPARDRARSADARTLAAATPASRDRYVDFLRVASIAVVVLGHWLMAAFTRDGDRLAGANALALVPGLWLATWLLQVMPVFFFIGGFSNLAALRSVARRGGGYAGYLSSRAVRLLRPTAVFVALWLVLPPLLTAAGVSDGMVGPAARLVAQPLWFLGVYLGVVATAPLMAGLHRRWGWRVPAALAAGAATVDLARFGLGLEGLGQANLALVWLFAHQLGFFYADGTLAGGSRRRLAGLAAAGLAGLVVLTASGAYPGSMVGMPGEPVSNMSPPTICIVALTIWQVGLVVLARGRVSAWLARPRAWALVVAASSLVMTVYLWHVTALLTVVGLVYGSGAPLPAPGGAVWWLTRPLWLALLGAVLLPLVLLFARFERPPAPPARGSGGLKSEARTHATGGHPQPNGSHPQPSGSPPVNGRSGGFKSEAGSLHCRLAAGFAASQLVIGLFGVVASGFDPLVGAAGGLVAGIRLDLEQSLAHLAVGGLLVRAARNGAAASAAPWLLSAALLGLLLLPLPAVGGAPLLARNLPGDVLHAVSAALTLAAGLTAPGRRQLAHPGGERS